MSAHPSTSARPLFASTWRSMASHPSCSATAAATGWGLRRLPTQSPTHTCRGSGCCSHPPRTSRVTPDHTTHDDCSTPTDVHTNAGFGGVHMSNVKNWNPRSTTPKARSRTCQSSTSRGRMRNPTFRCRISNRWTRSLHSSASREVIQQPSPPITKAQGMCRWGCLPARGAHSYVHTYARPGVRHTTDWCLASHH